MRYRLALVLMAALLGCGSSEEDPQDEEPIGVTAGDNEPIPGAPPELSFVKVNEAIRAAGRLPQLNDEYKEALYDIMRLTIDGRSQDVRRGDAISIFRRAEQALSEMLRIHSALSSAYSEISVECRRRYLAEDAEYGDQMGETSLLVQRRLYRQMAESFRATADMYRGQADTTLSLVHEVGTMRRALEPPRH